jgi:two-component sensor histidine kinase
MNLANSNGELDKVLVLAPFRKDADYISAFLRENHIEVQSAITAEELAATLAMEPGIIVISHEALDPIVVTAIARHIAEQPDWSEVPVLILLERAVPLARIRARLQQSWPQARLLFYTRPVAPFELLSGIQSNLLVRLRQRQVRDSIQREKELRLELNHRVKNILASVQSIFQMTKRGASSTDDLAAEFMGRLNALSGVHTAVFEAGGEAISLTAVVELTASPYKSDGRSRIEVSGADIQIGRDAGTTIALCLHELATNSIKYGALSRPEGRVQLNWTVEETDAPHFSLLWVESGGPPVQEPTRQGYGTRYVRSALGSLFGTPPRISFAVEGLRCDVSGPLSRIQSLADRD